MSKITKRKSTTTGRLPYAVVRVISSHPDWDEDDVDSEYEVSRHATKAAALKAAKLLGGSNGGPCNRAYRHLVRP